MAAYLSEERCEGRIKYVLHPERNAAAMRAHYAGRPTCKYPFKVTEDTCDGSPVPSACYVTVTREPGQTDRLELRRDSGAFRIDWRASLGYNPMPLITFKATKPPGVYVFRLVARISDYYGGEFYGWQKKVIAARLSEWRTSDSVYGYEFRETPGGKLAMAALADGKEHGVTVRLMFNVHSQSSSEAAMQFVQDGWDETDTEFPDAGSELTSPWQ